MRYPSTSSGRSVATTVARVRTTSRRQDNAWLPLVRSLTRTWRLTWWLWVAAIGFMLVAILAYKADPLGRWAPIMWLHTQPGVAGSILIVSSLVALCGLLASWLERSALRESLAPYVLRRANTCDARDYVPGYVGEVYMPRHDASRSGDADALSLNAARLAARRRALLQAESPLGICVFGRPGDGKTRLAWETLQAEFPRWTLLRWPHRPLPALELRTLGRRRIVLWLDDAHEFANPNEAVILNDLPRQCAQLGIRLVIIATCRDGADEARACAHLGSIMERLVAIRPAPITTEEAGTLALALEKVGTHASREDFTGSLASLIFGLRRLRTEIYPALPEAAQRVLATIKLLRSAGMFTYPVSTLRATAQEVFDLAPDSWITACGALIRTGFLRHGGTNANGERLLLPVSKAMLDSAVPEYLTRNGEASEDWPWLQEAFERRHDAEGLLCLGNALSELRTGGGPFLPYDPRISKQLAVTCFRDALEYTPRNRLPYDWAVTQANLGLALYRQAELATAYLRADLQRQSAAAYRAALEIITRDSLPAEWAMIQLSLASVYKVRAKDAVYAGDVDAACAALRDAWRYVENALTVYSLDADPVHYRQCLQLREGVLDAMRELECGPSDRDAL